MAEGERIVRDFHPGLRYDVAMDIAFRLGNWIRLARLGLMLVGATGLRAAPADDEAVIRQLNDDYIRSFLKCDVARYRELLAEDFHCVLFDGRLINKAEFLRQSAVPPGVTDFTLSEVTIRVYGDTAVVHGLVSYRRPDGSPALTRYTDTYARVNNRWYAVAAQLTRVAKPT